MKQPQSICSTISNYLLTLAIVLLILSSPSWSTVFISPGSVWKYLDNGSDQGTVWRDTTFNDSSWSVGTAELGFGDSGNGRPEVTQISSGYTTYYFRQSFTVSNVTSNPNVYLGVLRDDGAVVYLNGTEIFRTNMPAGSIYATTLAFSNVSSSDETTYFTTNIDTALLVEGTNLITAEVHQNAMSSGDLSFDLWLSTSTTFTSSTSVVNRGPYLQLGTSTSIYVRWRTPDATTSLVNYGTTLGNLTSFVSDAISTTEHEIILSDLSANTKYYYAIGTIGGVFEGDDIAHYFVTHPIVGTVKRSRIWVISDIGYGSAGQKSVLNGYLTYTGSTHTDLWLTGGDNSQSNGLDTQYQTEIFDVYTTLFRKSVIWPTMGNHDAQNSVDPTGPYFEMLSLPKNGEAGGVASGTEAYYSFNYGKIHFVCLNSANVDQSSTGAMLTWLKNDLTANTQDWLIAYWHHPPYYNSDSMRQNAVPILEDGGVDLVFSGHDHSYRRTDFIDGHYGTSGSLVPSMIIDDGDGKIDSDGAYAKPYSGITAHQGAVYMVVGTGGSSGSMVLDIDKNQLDVKYITTTGTISDYFTMVKDTATIPTVNSITRFDANPSSTATTIRFLVDLNHSVTGVDTSDFILSIAGLTGATITSISGSGSQYIVTVYTGIGNGTIRLDLIDDDSIKNGVNILLGGSGVGNGDYASSEVYTILSSNTPPGIATLLVPENESSMVNHTPTFIWTEATDSDPGDSIQYLLQVSTTSTFNTLAYDSGYSSSTTATRGTDLATGLYYWRVISQDTSLATNTSTIWTITLLNRPPTPTSLLNPTLGGSTLDHIPIFQWAAATDPDTEDVVQYLLQVSTTSTFGTLAYDSGYSSSTTATRGTDLATGLYYWRVISQDLSLAKNTSEVWTITLLNRPPTASGLLTPSRTTTNNRLPTFQWSAATDPDPGDNVIYTLQVSTDSSFLSGLAISTSGLIDTTFTPISPLTPECYYWRVISVDPSSAQNTSSRRWFIAFDTTQSRVITAPGTRIFYLGTWSSTTDYTPITLSVTSCLGTDTITITIFDAKHPFATDSSNKLSDLYFLSRWYATRSSGNMVKTAVLTFGYTDTDLIDAHFGTLAEDQIRIAQFSASSTWSWFNPQSINTTTNRVQLNGITSFSDWTLSGPYGVPVDLSRFFIEIEAEEIK